MSLRNKRGWCAAALLATLAANWGMAGEGGNASAAKQSVTFHTGWSSALQAAENDQAPVLAIFSAVWCGPCKKLKTETLENAAFREAGGPLHVVEIDIDGDAVRTQQFHVKGVPELVLLSSDLKILARRQGFLNCTEMHEWLTLGRKRLAQGAWEGIAAESSGSDLASAPAAELVQALGARAPKIRAQAAQALDLQREAAMPELLARLTDRQLSVRIGVSDLLRRWAPGAPGLDAWAEPEEREKQAGAIREWRAKNPALPAAPETKADAAETRTIEQAIKLVFSADPMARTDGMAELVERGPQALPRVREAIHAQIQASHAQAVRLLEDVRWAILIPDALEARVHARWELARGNTDQRQAAAERLGGAGTLALNALRELTSDRDPLVQEASAHALARVGGKDAMATVAGMLDAHDVNLRVVAAEKLGESKDAAAADHLAKLLHDPGELVVCTALASLGKLKAAAKCLAVTECFADTRWRVRANAAEVTGQLCSSGASAHQAAAGAALEKLLLEETDSFVVRNTLVALKTMGRAPDIARLAALAGKMTSIRPMAAGMLAENGSQPAIDALGVLYDQADASGRREIVAALAGDERHRSRGSEPAAAAWQAFIEKIAASKNTAERRGVLRLLAAQSESFSSKYIERFLQEAGGDEELQLAAAQEVLRIAACDWGIGRDSNEENRERRFGILRAPDPGKPAKTKKASAGETAKAEAEKAETVKTVKKEHERWHELLGALPNAARNPALALAYYVTGNGTDLDGLKALLITSDEANPQPHNGSEIAAGLMLYRMPWPQSKETLGKLTASPEVYSRLLKGTRWAKDPVREFLSSPSALAAAVQSATGETFERFAEHLASGRSDGGAAATPDLAKTLAKSSAPGAHALGIYLLGAVKDELPLCRAALQDASKWVRMAAIQAVAAQSEQAEREGILGALLSDPEPVVTGLAAVALMNPILRHKAGLGSDLSNFRFENTRTWRSVSYSESELLLPPPPENKPAFMDALRKRWADAQNIADAEQKSSLEHRLVLLLGQYGDYTGFDQMWERWKAERSDALAESLLIGMQMKRDSKYLPVLKARMDKIENQYELRNLLKALQGLSGSEVRELRRDINARLRQKTD